MINGYPIDGTLCAAVAMDFGAIGPSVCSLARAQPPLAYWRPHVLWGDQCAPFAEKISRSTALFCSYYEPPFATHNGNLLTTSVPDGIP